MNALAASVGAALCALLVLGRYATVPRSRAVDVQRAAVETRGVHAIWARRPRFRPSTTVEPAAVAHWADDLARSLRHGMTLRAALHGVVPNDHALAQHANSLRQGLDRGATVPDACDRWIERTNEPLLRALATVLTATAIIGGSAAAPLDRLAAAMRQRGSEELERHAHSAQATMSARVLTIIPVAVLTLLVVTDADVRSVVTQPAGALAIGAGLLLNLAGGLWMRKIVRQHAGAGRS